MATLYLFVGYPGSGKTTVAQIICGATNAVHIWADKERRDMFRAPTHSADESAHLYTHLNDRTRDLLREGKSVVFDTNFNFYKDREHLRKIAAECNADVKLIWLKTDQALAKHRATNESHDQPTRLFGNMEADDFDRIAGHLQPPEPSEHAIVFVGKDLQKSEVLDMLQLV
jgi:predicted kinase